MYSYLGYLFYYPFYLISKLSILGLNINVHARHSFHFKKILPFVSDIDLTFYALDRKSSLDFKKVQVRYKTMKRLIPILGEANFWNIEILKMIYPITNYFELKRDPLLLGLIDCEVPKITNEMKLLYLIKLFRGDLKNLRKCLSKRFEKYSYSLEFLSPKRPLEKSDVLNLENLMNYIKYEVLNSECDEVVDQIKKIIQNEAISDNGLGAIWKVDYDYFEENFEEFSRKELLINCLHWEVVGCVTQTPITESTFNLVQHLTRTIELLKRIDDKNLKSYTYIYDEILKYAVIFRK